MDIEILTKKLAETDSFQGAFRHVAGCRTVGRFVCNRLRARFQQVTSKLPTGRKSASNLLRTYPERRVFA